MTAPHNLTSLSYHLLDAARLYRAFTAELPSRRIKTMQQVFLPFVRRIAKATATIAGISSRRDHPVLRQTLLLVHFMLLLCTILSVTAYQSATVENTPQNQQFAAVVQQRLNTAGWGARLTLCPSLPLLGRPAPSRPRSCSV
jgi:hypothetical protein